MRDLVDHKEAGHRMNTKDKRTERNRSTRTDQASGRTIRAHGQQHHLIGTTTMLDNIASRLPITISPLIYERT